MRHLVYRVHRVPPVLQDFIFDFGSLSRDTELLYVQSMVARRMGHYSEHEHALAATLMHTAQNFVRSAEQEVSATSLRDVKRCITLVLWFCDALTTAAQRRDTAEPPPEHRAAALILGLAFVYFFRLRSDQMRADFWALLRSAGDFRDRHLKLGGWVPATASFFVVILQWSFCEPHLAS